MTEREHFDVVVVGAGIAGIAFAKTYLSLHPDSSLVILDRNSSFGGTWSADRVYPGLTTNNLAGTLEYSDSPLAGRSEYGSPRRGVDHVPGETVSRYLEDHAIKHRLHSKARFGIQVTAIRLNEDPLNPPMVASWDIDSVYHKTSQPASPIRAKKLVVATGLTSQAQAPHFPGSDKAGAPEVLHFVDMPEKQIPLAEKALKTGAQGKPSRVVVVGGGKSAFDAVHGFVTRGVPVHWVIRAKGNGPVWMSPPRLRLPWGSWVWDEKIVSRRVVGWFSPCVWEGSAVERWARQVLHGGGWFGNLVMKGFMGGLRRNMLSETRWDENPKTAVLVPDTSPFWAGTSLAHLNYESGFSFSDHIRSGVIEIHTADPVSLSPGALRLSDGTDLQCVAVVSANKWLPSMPFDIQPPGKEPLLGVPYPQGRDDPWSELSAAADVELLRRYPLLASAPALSSTPSKFASNFGVDPLNLTKFRLHRFMVSPELAARGDRSLVFLLMMASTQTTTQAEIQSLWACAFFDDQISAGGLVQRGVASLEDKEARTRRVEDVKRRTAYETQWAERRYPKGGSRWFPDFSLDCLPYLDLLLDDLGLNKRRKGGWLNETFGPYGQEDYKGIVEEWKSKNGGIPAA